MATESVLGSTGVGMLLRRLGRLAVVPLHKDLQAVARPQAELASGHPEDAGVAGPEHADLGAGAEAKLLQPMHVVDQILSIYAGTRGYLDQVPVSEVSHWEQEFLEYVRNKRNDVWQKVDEAKDSGSTFKSDEDEVAQAVRGVLEEFQQTYKPPQAAATA